MNNYALNGTLYPLYDPADEHDACGVGAIVDVRGRASHALVDDALKIAERLAHRAGCDALGTTGDGVGIITQIPHALFAKIARERGKDIGAAREYGVGMLFMHSDARAVFENCAAALGFKIAFWREVPVRAEILGAGALDTMPRILQCVIPRPRGLNEFELKLCALRKAFERAGANAYICSLSSRTLVYKGMMLVNQLRHFYIDLQNEDFASALAMVHSRFSTNTQPSWERAHPHRMLLHNGEINTIHGNAEAMRRREKALNETELAPIIAPGGSDSMKLDNALEYLTLRGMPMCLAMSVLMPPAWRAGNHMPDDVRAMYHYYSALMEPWDGPAAVLFTDGDSVGAALDRNGLRPLRAVETNDGRLILSSEAGVLPIEHSNITKRGRLSGGKMLVCDTRRGVILYDENIKRELAARKPYAEYAARYLSALTPAQARVAPIDYEKYLGAFGYAWEDVNDMILPMAEYGAEPIGSMGADTPLAVLSGKHPLLSDYFKQRFAQVTNPPIDALREQNVTDAAIYLGADGNILSEAPDACAAIELASPVITREQLEGLNAPVVRMCFEPRASLESAVEHMLDECDKTNSNIIVLTDRGIDAHNAPIPALLAVSALSSHTRASIVVETGDARDAHQIALLLSYGAKAVAPYLAHECVRKLCAEGRITKSPGEAIADFDRAAVNAVKHIASKMGISALQSYQGARIFEAVGIDYDVIDKYFKGTKCAVGGAGLDRLKVDVLYRMERSGMDSVGRHKLRAGEACETHLYTPEAITLLQRAVRQGERELYDKYSALINDAHNARTLRGVLELAYDARRELPLAEVEPATDIVKRFKTGAMSYGSISEEAHECIALAMNRLGGKSNTGEGGERAARLGAHTNSAIKQVASGRFGVTREYLESASEIQIKMAQGAKPGEGGHLPGGKVYPWIAETRLSTPGVALISPPPHHDIYSIEDLAQLIYDLKCVNPSARISVKLVSESGVGTIASGVAKAGADVILISGYDGGTGAAPLTSIHGAGLPWEIGLAEAHQLLCKNGLRERVALETDGKLMTGRDVIIAALLGAEEFGFATGPLIAMGCRMLRACHNDACPFGIATQDPALRARFAGSPEHVMNYMLFIAEEARGIMAKLGARTLAELVGRADLLKQRQGARADMTRLIAFSENTRSRGFAPARPRQIPRCGAIINVENTYRSFGAELGKGAGDILTSGFGGESFGAFLPQGARVTLTGEANDYLGKGLSGGEIRVIPPENFHEGDTLIGNVALYGATSGRAYIAGMAGERFCVRNSGARAVCEGAGNHGCEYMTGGRALIIGDIGENFAAGMSGGIAYVLCERGDMISNVNQAMVEVERARAERDAEDITALLSEHLAATNSPKARLILNDFNAYLPKFYRVIPTEYKKIVEGRRSA